MGETRGNPKSLPDHQRWDRWYADRWAHLLNRLDSIKEGNGTRLDNTLIVFGSDTTANTSTKEIGPHRHDRFPMWMAGGGNFAFKTGQIIKAQSANQHGPIRQPLVRRWVVHQRLLTSVCQAFGMPDQKFGDIDPGSGPLPQLQRV